MGMRVRIMAAFVSGAVLGCSAHGPKTVQDPDPAIKIPAIKEAVRTHDRRAIPQLVKDLESDDPAVRFYAIDALHSLTGQTFGYRYYDDEDHRKPAVEQWKKWLADHPQAAR